MLVTWAYLGFSGSYVYGFYQSDSEDLKSFLRQKGLKSVYLLYCRLQKGQEYIWRNPRCFKGGSDFRAGWVSVS